MVASQLGPSLPFFDPKEQLILEEIRRAGGDVFRDELRKEVKGSNTTFIRKLMELKKRGIIEEYKRGNGRMKTSYRLTDHARRVFEFADALRLEKWFSASQKIEFFPEFEEMARLLTGTDIDVYKMLGVEPQRIYLETSLASSESPPLAEEEVREVLSMCSAFLQNMVTGRLHQRFTEKVEGYIVFRYRLEKPKEELQRLLPACILDYAKGKEALKQHRALSNLVELAIKHSNVLPMVTMTALNIAKALKLREDEEELIENYRAFKEGEEPLHVNRIRTAASVLTIFKKLYEVQGARDNLGP